MRFIAAIALLAGLTACTSEVQNYTAISTHSIDYSKPISAGTITKNVKGEDVVHVILTIPTGIAEAQEAINNALIANNADMLLNVKLYRTWWWAFLYGQTKYVVEGDAVKFN